MHSSYQREKYPCENQKMLINISIARISGLVMSTECQMTSNLFILKLWLNSVLKIAMLKNYDPNPKNHKKHYDKQIVMYIQKLRK